MDVQILCLCSCIEDGDAVKESTESCDPTSTVVIHGLGPRMTELGDDRERPPRGTNRPAQSSAGI